MKKFLQLDSKNISITLLDEPTPSLLIGWNLNFHYLIQNISVCLNNNHQDNLLVSNIRMHSGEDDGSSSEILIDKMEIDPNEDKPIFFQKMTLEKPGYLLNTLLIQI